MGKFREEKTELTRINSSEALSEVHSGALKIIILHFLRSLSDTSPQKSVFSKYVIFFPMTEIFSFNELFSKITLFSNCRVSSSFFEIFDLTYFPETLLIY